MAMMETAPDPVLSHPHADAHASMPNDEPPRSVRPGSTSVDASRLRMGYQWPASRLTRADMIMLATLRNKTGRPMNELLHEAVSALYQLFREGTPENHV
jgi:hypothetical protein